MVDTENINATKKEIFSKVNSSMETVRTIKAGRTLKSVLEIPDLNKTLDWAINYVHTNEGLLIDNLIDLHRHLKQKQSNNSVECDVTIHSTEVSSAIDSVYSNDKTSVSNKKSPTKLNSSNQINLLLFNRQYQTKNDEISNNANLIRNSSLRSNTPTSPTSSNHHYNNRSYTNKSKKSLNLAAQLDNLKLNGTESFLNSISPKLRHNNNKHHYSLLNKHNSLEEHQRNDSSPSYYLNRNSATTTSRKKQQINDVHSQTSSSTSTSINSLSLTHSLVPSRPNSSKFDSRFYY